MSLKVLLTPGIGNQFFQVLRALIICENLKIDSFELILSKRYISKKHGGFTLLDLGVTKHLNFKSANFFELILYFFWHRLGHNSIPKDFCEHRIISEGNIEKLNIQTKNLNQKNWIICGYFQNEFINNVNRNLSAFISKSQLIKQSNDFEIPTSLNVIHIRGGDYLKIDYYKTLNFDYYYRCISASGFEKGPWYIISDDLSSEYVNFLIGQLIDRGIIVRKLSDSNDISFDFLSMVFSRVLICANSTFSLAAAYIKFYMEPSDTKNKSYVPREWYSSGTSPLIADQPFLVKI